MHSTLMKAAAVALLLAAMPMAYADNHGRLLEVLEARSDDAKARDQYRRPEQTLQLFGIEPGMTVIDALPGSWYGNIIAPLLGEEGRYIGVRYGEWFFQNRFGDEYEARWESAQSFLTEWPEQAKKYGGGADVPATEAYFFPGLPRKLNRKVDAVLFFRALHHTNRYETKYLDMTAEDAFRVLKRGGIVGIVQHRAPEDADDDWAKGGNGYIKQSRVIEAFKAAGFELDNASEINANRKDQPVKGDMVWRLPPSTRDNPETMAIGESDRMTLVFRKP